MPTDERYQDLVVALAELMVNVGIISAVMPQYPQHVQENFDEKVGMIVSAARAEIAEIQSFGEGFD